MGDGFSKGEARSNPAFEPSESSSLLQPSSQNTVQVRAKPGLPSFQSQRLINHHTSSCGGLTSGYVSLGASVPLEPCFALQHHLDI